MRPILSYWLVHPVLTGHPRNRGEARYDAWLSHGTPVQGQQRGGQRDPVEDAQGDVEDLERVEDAAAELSVDCQYLAKDAWKQDEELRDQGRHAEVGAAETATP